MGWPLAVSAGLMERSPRALVSALGPLAVGHLLAMLLVIFPFALLDHSCRMAAPDSGRRQPPGHRLRYLPARPPTPSTSAGADTADAIGAVVLCGRNRARRGTDAGADLSRALPGSRPRQRPRGGREPHQRQPWHGGAGRHRARHRDDRCRRMFGVAGLPLSRSQIRIAELVQSGYDPGPSASFWSEPLRWCSALRSRAGQTPLRSITHSQRDMSGAIFTLMVISPALGSSYCFS